MTFKNNMNHASKGSTNNSSCTVTPISARWAASRKASHVEANKSYGKLGARNKASRLMTFSVDETFERWPFPFTSDLNASQCDGAWCIWACPVTKLNTRYLFGTLIELLGCRNEGWARNAYCGLVDIIEHGDKCQVIRGLENGGIQCFYKLFIHHPNVTQTWDGFAAGLDILERLIVLSPGICLIVSKVLPYILRPICKQYRQREVTMAFTNAGKGVRNAKTSHPGKSSSSVKMCLMGAPKFPFLQDLELWLYRLHSMFASCLGGNNADFFRISGVLKRLVPDFECTLYSTPTSTNQQKCDRGPRTSNVYEELPALRRSMVGAVASRPVPDSSGIPGDPRVAPSGPLALQSGPTAHHLGPVYLKSGCTFLPQNSGYSGMKFVDEVVHDRMLNMDKDTKKKGEEVEDDYDQRSVMSNEIRARAVSIVNAIMRRLDTMTTSEFPRGPSTRVGDSMSTTTRDVSSNDELPVDAPAVDPDEAERWKLKKPIARVDQLFSKLSQTLTRPSDDQAIIEDLEHSHPGGMDDDDELNESSLSLEHPVTEHQLEGNTEYGLESLSMVVNRSTGGNIQLTTHEPVLSNSTLSSEDHQEYSFKVLKQSPEATSRSQHEQFLPQTPKVTSAVSVETTPPATAKTALEWKLIRGAKTSGKTSTLENEQLDEGEPPDGVPAKEITENTSIKRSGNMKEVMTGNRANQPIPVISLFINKKKDSELPEHSRRPDPSTTSDIHLTGGEVTSLEVTEVIAPTSRVALPEGVHLDQTQSNPASIRSNVYVATAASLLDARSDLSLSMQVNFQPGSMSVPISNSHPALEISTQPTMKIRSESEHLPTASIEALLNPGEQPEQSSLSPQRESIDTSVGVNSIVTSERNIRMNSSLEVHASFEDNPITPNHDGEE